MTTNSIEHAVRQVINYMHVNLGQDLTIDDLARTAMFSKFHFTRIFREVTGTSPGRFLSALRMQEAKRLLVRTNFSVADISSQVGYSSVGTFSSRFKSCVGVSPSAYRALRGVVRELPTALVRPADVAQRLSVRGRVSVAADGVPGRVFVGLFPGCVLQGRPVCWAVLEQPGAFVLRDVPSGTWYLLAHSVAQGPQRGGGPGEPDGLLVGRHGPLSVHAGALLRPASVVLRPIDLLDPPVLLAQIAPGAAERAAVR